MKNSEILCRLQGFADARCLEVIYILKNSTLSYPSQFVFQPKFTNALIPFCPLASPLGHVLHSCLLYSPRSIALTLVQALARQLDPREGNAPLRHRLRKFSKPWAAMVRAFAAKNTVAVSPQTAAPTAPPSNDQFPHTTDQTRSSSPTTTNNTGASSCTIVSPPQATRNCLDGSVFGSAGGRGRAGSVVKGIAGCAGGAAGSGEALSLRLFLRRVPCPAKRPLYWEVYPEDSLGSALGAKVGRDRRRSGV